MVTRIWGWATDGFTCDWYRLHLPLRELTRARPGEYEYHVELGPPPVEWLHGEGRRIVIGQRIAGHNPAWLDLCDNPNVLATYDLDDDLIDVDPANTVPYSIYQPIRQATLNSIGRADLVTVSTPHLADKMANTLDMEGGYFPPVAVLPNCMDPVYLRPPRPEPAPGQPLVIGWAGSPFHAQDWSGVAEQLAEFVRHAPRKVEFVAMGADYMSPHVPTRWGGGLVPIGEHLQRLDGCGMHIGLAPLNDSAFNGSKSWCKALEYATRGIVPVCSARGQYPEWAWPDRMEYTDAAAIVTAGRSWGAVLTDLCDDDLRAQYAATAHWRARGLTIDKLIHHWHDTYQEGLNQ